MTPILPHPAAETQGPVLTPERQLLWDAAAEMERRGKWSGAPEGPHGEVCFIGALWAAQERAGLDASAPDQMDVRDAACKIFRRKTAPHSTVDFSDRNDQATVIAAMRTAAITGANP